MILAAAASGKTHWADSLPSTKALVYRKDEVKQEIRINQAGTWLVVDGDMLVWAFSSWPSHKLWFKEDKVDYVHFHNLAVILVNAGLIVAGDGPDTHVIVVFNGGMEDLDQVREMYLDEIKEDEDRDVQLTVCLVEIDEVTHREYIQKRIEKQEGSWPRNWTDAHNNRLYLNTMAQRKNWPVYASFEEALESLD